MANERDIQWAIESAEEGLSAGDLSAAKAGVEELRRLVAVFEGVAEALDDGEGKSRAISLADRAKEAADRLGERVCELEIDQREPGFDDRVRARRSRERAQAIGKINRAAEVLSLVAPRIAGLIELARAGRPLGEMDLRRACAEDCPHCGDKLSLGARFCPSCGKGIGATCVKCEAPLPQGARFCPMCGERSGEGG